MCEVNGRTFLAYLYLVSLRPTVSGGLNSWDNICQIFLLVLIPGDLIHCVIIRGEQNPSSKKTQIRNKIHKKAIRPCWAECRAMHPWEEAELPMGRSDRGAALCRVLCRRVICLLHTLIHPQPWEHSSSYTIQILLLISCTYGYKTSTLSRDYLHLPLHVACCFVNIFFQTVYTNVSKIREKTHVKWYYLQINYTLRNLKY